MKQKLRDLQGERTKYTIIVRDFNNSILIINRANRKNVSKDMADLSNTIYWYFT